LDLQVEGHEMSEPTYDERSGWSSNPT